MQLKLRFYRILAASLCLLLSPLPGLSQTPSGGTQPAGSVTALDPSATRNGAGVTLRDPVQWNDELQTNTAGRLRVNLRDGSILSLGSNARLRVVEHNAVAQQTTLELLYGRLRSQVVKLTQPNSRFEVRTPTAVAGVIGTDFVIIATADRTTVIVFSGIVQVTPLNGAGGALNQSQSVNVNPNQQVEVTVNGVGPVTAITQQLIRDLILQTAVSHAGLAATVGVQTGTSLLRAVLIAAGSVAAGTVAGIAVANATHNPTPPPKPPSGPGIPPQ
jgi:hypothetical protein